MARAHGAKMTGKGKGMSKKAAKKMMREVPKSQRSRAFKRKEHPAAFTLMEKGAY